MDRLLEKLPRGHTLPPRVWAVRHRVMVGIVLAHVPALLVFGLARGYAAPHVLLDIAPIALLGLLGAWSHPSRTIRAACVSLGLLTSSAMLVHLWGGVIEAHFHFFVMVTLLATYEEWRPYLLAIGFVVLHHGITGVLEAHSVYAHLGAEQHPWGWAAIHGGFITALALANVVSWRLNEDVRAEMRRTEDRFRSAFDDAPSGMALVSPDGRITRVNAALAARTGHDADALVGMPLAELLPADERERVRSWPEPTDGRSEERRFVRGDGTIGWALWQHSLMPGHEGEEPTFVSHMLDISVRKRAESELDYQAHHDALTGLPNRTLFSEQLDLALAAAADGRRPAVLFVDLDNFKLVNDSMGHGPGDRLLVAVAERLRRALRPDDLVARFGGDEFAVLLRSVRDERDTDRIADRLLSALRAPVVVDEEQRFVTASIGICLADPDGTATSDELLRDADAAMYRAKERGKARAEVFDRSLRDQVVERVALEHDLRGAAARGELVLEYQPFVDLATGRVTGVEALVRWAHPRLGLVPPLRFITIAEQSGLINEIGDWVLQTACAQAVQWPDDLEVAVNVSPRQLSSVRFPDDVAATLAETGLRPGRLCLEVTESAFVADIEHATHTLERLRALGVRMAIDDFGVGYASLSQLKALPPIDVLKVDRSFVSGVLADPEDRAIVEAVVRLAQSLGLETVAEGVETADHAEALRDLDCKMAQGYHFARPAHPSAVDELLRRQEAGELV